MNNPMPFPARTKPCAIHHWRLGRPVVRANGQTERTDDCRYCDAVRLVLRTEPEPDADRTTV